MFNSLLSDHWYVVKFGNIHTSIDYLIWPFCFEVLINYKNVWYVHHFFTKINVYYFDFLGNILLEEMIYHYFEIKFIIIIDKDFFDFFVCVLLYRVQ